MPRIYASDGTSWLLPETETQIIIAHELQTSDGKTTLDAGGIDKTHLVLHGTLDSSEKYIVCKDASNVTKFEVNHEGEVIANALNLNTAMTGLGLTTTAQQLLINANTAEVDKIRNAGTATDVNTPETLVKRAATSSTDGTEFGIISCNRLSASGTTANIACYDSAVNFVAQDSNGNNLPANICRFGKNTESYDFSGDGDGIHLVRDDNECLITCAQDSATIRIEGEKNASANYFEIKNELNELLFAITKAGHLLGNHLLEDLLSELNDQEAHSMLLGPSSLYLGPIKISFLNDTLTFEKLSTIPTVLATAPYNITTADLGGRDPDELSARQYLVLARNKVSDTTLKARDIFTNAGEWQTVGITYANTLTSDAQGQINTINTWLNAADTDIDTLQAVNIDDTQTVYVDSKRTDSYTQDGTLGKPYKTLSAALTSRLTENATVSYIFMLRPGVYEGVISVDRTTATQSFAIQGSGVENTFIQCADITTNALYFRDFKSITVTDLTIKQCAYGFYPRSCTKVVLDRVRFLNCGSIGATATHNLQGTQSYQAQEWASSNTSNGGACRIRSVEEVIVQNCEVEYCLRGLRIQDCGSTQKTSIVQNNKIFRTLESGIYLASGSYAYKGCENFMVSNNQVTEAFNNGILIIGAYRSQIMNNSVVRSANAGIQQWSSLDCVYSGNQLFDCNVLSYNGIGVLGDAWGNLVVGGNSGISAVNGKYIASITDNVILSANIGRAAAIYAIRIQSEAYPGTQKLIVADNKTDAVNALENDEDLSITSVQESSSGGTATTYVLLEKTDENTEGTKVTLANDRQFQLACNNELAEYHYQLPDVPLANTEINVLCTNPLSKIVLYLNGSQKFHNSANTGDQLDILISQNEIQMAVLMKDTTMLDANDAQVNVDSAVEKLIGIYPANGDLTFLATSQNLLKRSFGQHLSIGSTGNSYYVLDGTTEDNLLDLVPNGTFVCMIKTAGSSSGLNRYWDSHVLKLYVSNQRKVRLKAFATVWTDFQTLSVNSDYMLTVSYTDVDVVANTSVTIIAEKLSDNTTTTSTKNSFTSTLLNGAQWEKTKYLYAQGGANQGGRMSSIVHCKSTPATITTVQNYLRSLYDSGTTVASNKLDINTSRKLVYNTSGDYWIT